MAIVWAQRLENFISECNTAATQLLSSTDEVLSLKEPPRTVLEARSLLSRHEQHVTSVLQLPSVCRLCTQHHGQTELSQLRTDVKQFGDNAVIFQSVFFALLTVKCEFFLYLCILAVKCLCRISPDGPSLAVGAATHPIQTVRAHCIVASTEKHRVLDRAGNACRRHCPSSPCGRRHLPISSC